MFGFILPGVNNVADYDTPKVITTVSDDDDDDDDLPAAQSSK
jgi:hypothetical protein